MCVYNNKFGVLYSASDERIEEKSSIGKREKGLEIGNGIGTCIFRS